MNPKLWLAGRAATVARSIAAEKARPRVPRTREDIPLNGLDVTEEWLTDVLCRDHEGARVVSFSTELHTQQTTTRAAIRVQYNAEGEQAGLPTQLYSKTTTGFRQRLVLGAAHMLEGESMFYTRFRPSIRMEAPEGYWGRVDPVSWRSMILMEDIAATKGAQFIEPTTPLTRAQIEDIIRNLAACHGAWWEDPQLGGLKTGSDHISYVGKFVDMGGRAAVGLKRAQALVPMRLHGQADRIWKATERALELGTTQQPHTLLHGDTHVGQAYITSDGRMGLSDWQSIMAGGWGYDYGYFVATALDPDDRRAWEHELLDLYLTELAAAGGRPPATEDAWLTYRQNVCYACSGWAFVYGRAFYQPEMQADDVCREVIRRVTAAIDDLDALAALGV